MAPTLRKLREAWDQGGVLGVLRGARRRLVLRAVELAKRPLARDTSGDPTHAMFRRFVETVGAMDHPRVLEIGARARSGTVFSDRFAGTSYVGFDIRPGPNVDVVGDVHELSRHFPEGHFDAAFGIAVFEHLAMPWKAVLELNRVLRPGGLVFVSTHPTYPPHDRPWDYWRFTRDAFAVLFGRAMGFELVEAAEGLPCAIVPLGREPMMVGLWREPAHLAVTALARKVGPPDPRLRWDVPLGDAVTTSYPA